MRSFIFIFLLLISNPFSSQDIGGKWYGVAEVMGRELPIGIELMKVYEDWSANLLDPKKNKVVMPFDSAEVSGNKIFLLQKRIGFIFSGTYKNDSIIGVAKQNGLDIPLVLTKNLLVSKEIKRPQTPEPPFDYYTEEISIYNSKDSITLSGTLTLPDATGKKVPVVILISGSGPQNRDSEILGHKPFAVIADHLAKQGIGSFRYDERGVGKSTGKYRGSDLNDFYSDVDAIVNLISKRKEISELGLAGHSEGGIIAPKYAANNRRKIDFVILLAGPGVPVKEMMHEQRRIQFEAMGMSKENIAKNKAMFIEIDNIVLNEENEEIKVKRIRNAVEKSLEGNQLSKEEKENAISTVLNQVNTPWYKSFVATVPSTYLQKIRCRSLVIAGGKDTQVPMKENVEGFKEHLNRKMLFIFRPVNTYVTHSNLNHLFQPCVFGTVEEYGRIETTISRDVLFNISDFINKQ